MQAPNPFLKGHYNAKFVTQISLSIHAMRKTIIFIIQLCAVFELFTIEVVKCHFCLNVLTSGWVKAIIDFHLMKRRVLYVQTF